FGSLNMIPDVTPNGVFYLPPTGWLTSFYNPPKFFLLIKSIISAPIIITDSSINFVKLNSSYIVVLGSFMLVTLIFLIVNFILVSKTKG
ncbi:hypothetical protein LMB19_00470, partial [Limosilactobacillus reuteri]|nr:hypothetical protein [Limosilactobacillus reuteri]